MLKLPEILKRPELSDAQKQQVIMIAESILSLEGTEGWQHFKKAAEELANSQIPHITHFDAQQATEIASKVAFASGVRACLALMERQKETLKALKKT